MIASMCVLAVMMILMAMFVMMVLVPRFIMVMMLMVAAFVSVVMMFVVLVRMFMGSVGFLTMLMMMMMFMPVFVMVITFTLILMLGFILLMLVGRPFMNAEFDTRNALALLALEVHVKIANIELREFPLKCRGFHSKIGQRTHGHVAADARDAIEIKNFHGVLDFMNPWAFNQKMQSSAHGCKEPGVNPLLRPMP